MTGYAVKHEQVAVAGAADLHIRSLLDRMQFSDPLDVALRLGISSAAWPLFGLVWPSGLQLAASMAARPMVDGERILEIGCGLAVASLVCHRRGADVTASDRHPLAEGFLAENLRLNNLPPLPYRHGAWSSRSASEEPDLPDERAVVRGGFDLIIGADVLYERDEDATLAGFIAHHARPGAEIWIVDPDRGNRSAFSRQMLDLGFGLREERLAVPETVAAPRYSGRMLKYARRAAV